MQIKAKKSLGQNFLIDQNVIEKITNTQDIENRVILEIGPGTGNLTSLILEKKPKEFCVVEKDYDLAEKLKKSYKNKITIINKDVLKIEENLLFSEKIKVFGNLPYIRISPDHGPNGAMLGKNLSSPKSLINALNFLNL